MLTVALEWLRIVSVCNLSRAGPMKLTTHYRPVMLCLTILFICDLSQPVNAQAQTAFCRSARQELTKNRDLAVAVTQVFGVPSYDNSAEKCVYPVAVLRYQTANVLVTADEDPGASCHACSSNLSAYILRHEGGSARLAAKHENFGTSGDFSNPGELTSITLAGRDAFIVSNGTMHQGYGTEYMRVFAFHNGKAINVSPDKFIRLGIDNSGALPNPRNADSVEGKWSVNAAGDRLSVTYSGILRGRKLEAVAVWKLQGEKLVLVSGGVPARVQEGY